MWDYDVATKNDLIGVAEFDLPDLQQELLRGSHLMDFPRTLLTDPSRKEGSKSRGEIEGSFTLHERGGADDPKELTRLRTEVKAKEQEIRALKGRLGLKDGTQRSPAPPPPPPPPPHPPPDQLLLLLLTRVLSCCCQ